MQASCVLCIVIFQAIGIFVFIVVFTITWPFFSTALAFATFALAILGLAPAFAFCFLTYRAPATAFLLLVSIFATGLLLIVFASSIFECLRNVRVVVRAFGIRHQAKHLLIGLLLVPFLMFCRVASDLKTNQGPPFSTKKHVRSLVM